nr:hypothetical protein [Tanacetum cinerariifolium]
MLIHQGEGSGTPTEPHHTPFPEADTSHPTTSSIPLPSIPTAPIPPGTQPDPTPIRQYSRRARIAQSSALLTVADEPASPMRDAQEEEIVKLKERVKVLEDRKDVPATQSGDDAPIKGRSINEGEAAVERISDDSKEIARVLTSIDAAIVLARGIDVPTSSGSIPTLVPLLLSFPLAVKLVPLLDKSNETIAKYLQEYQDFASELPLEKRIELISDLVKYQDNYSKVYKFQSQQRRPMTKKQKREYYMSMIRNNLGWRVKDFKEEAPEIETSTEEFTEEKMKEMMQLVPVEDFYVQALQVKHPIIDWKVHKEGQRSYWQIIRLGEWKLYDLSGVHHVTAKDKEIFMLVEKDYPLRKDTLNPLSQKLKNENVELEFQALNYARENAHVKATYKNLFTLFLCHALKLKQ